MRSLYLTFMTVVAVTLTGCASVKPELTSEGYKSFSTIRAMTKTCAVAGLMSPETAALGQTYAEKSVNTYQVDTDRLDRETQKVASRIGYPNREDCIDWTMYILRHKTREEARSVSSSQPSMPRSTRCNTAFGQTFCTSY